MSLLFRCGFKSIFYLGGFILQGFEGIGVVAFQFILMISVSIMMVAWLRLKRQTGRVVTTDSDKNLIRTQPATRSEVAKQQPTSKSWAERLSSGLSRTRSALTERISDVFGAGSKLDAETLEKIHEVLYRADLGVHTADRVIEELKQQLGSETEVSWQVAKEKLNLICQDIFSKSDDCGKKAESKEPHVTLVVGVNGVGKTTTIGKLAAHAKSRGEKVLLGAADTYRAAAIDQLKVWADRAEVEIVANQPGSDPAAVAFDTVKAAVARGAERVFVDTAGRLHNKKDLMSELQKIKRVMQKEVPNSPHEVWLVVDATTGQNALQQVSAFSEVVELTGVVVTKLDGTAKGGVIISIAERFKKPVKYIGVGESMEDLQEFKASEFVDALFAN